MAKPCYSAVATMRQFHSGGSLRRRALRDRHLRERLQNLSQTTTLIYRSWKLYYCAWQDRQPQRLETGLGASAVECSPSMYRDDDGVHVSFIGGLPTAERIIYHLYSMSGPSLEELSLAQQVVPHETSIGFVSPSHICFGGRNLLLQERASGAQYTISVPVDHLYRATFRADDSSSLILTGLNKNGAPQTLLFNLKSKETFQVVSDVPVYKSTLFEDQLITAVKEGDGIENRQLMSSTYTLKKCDNQNRVQCTDVETLIDLPELQLA